MNNPHLVSWSVAMGLLAFVATYHLLRDPQLKYWVVPMGHLAFTNALYLMHMWHGRPH